ncbi:hypothetical protein [Acidocella sp.]|jgi:hypothetical protein|uniref:hypothetical protein n=1 Tax=Acidocella sp. TaxID=50710 RepID=UPI002F4286BB
MKIRELVLAGAVAVAVAVAVAAPVLLVVGCSVLQSVASTVTAAGPQLAADVAAACAAVPAVSAAASGILKGGASNTAQSDLAIVQKACNAAVADAPTVLAVLAGIEAQIKTAANPATAPAASGLLKDGASASTPPSVAPAAPASN